jgi:hypothetical protein
LFITPTGTTAKSLTTARSVPINVTPNHAQRIDFTYTEKKVSPPNHHQIIKRKSEKEIPKILTGIKKLNLFFFCFLITNNAHSINHN